MATTGDHNLAVDIHTSPTAGWQPCGARRVWQELARRTGAP